MRIFYDKAGKKISRKKVREKMEKEKIHVGNNEDKKIKNNILKNMTEEEFVKLNGMSYKDYGGDK